MREEPAMRQLTVLVVEDDPALRRTLCVMVESAGHRAVESSGVADAIKEFRASTPDVVLADHVLGDGDAFDLLRRFPEIDAHLPIIVITGERTIHRAVTAMKRGAWHFTTKPPRPAELLRLIESAAAERRGKAGEDQAPFVGASAAVRSLASAARRVAVAEGPVLLRGETGTGKSVIARWIHRHSPRAAGPFVAVNCAGLAREQSDSVLFGHEKGAFAGASARRGGLVESADRGTLFLDEVGDLDLSVQAKLLEFIEDGRFTRLGSVEERRADVRIVAATQRDLERRAADGAFREDLYFRVSRLPLHVPPLRQRLDDLPSLVQGILASFAPARARGVSLEPGVLERLRGHAWRGNIRELRNVIERTVLLGEGATIGAKDLRLEAAAPNGPAHEGPAVTLADLERQHVERTLAAVGFHVSEAARRLGIPRSTLYQRIREYGIPLRRR
jgi:DNA-binding NtrC family response regulator